jgi:GPH family glycoside/pentoside/hexuronide:cation symporter
MTYLSYFYTDVFGLSAAAAAGVLLVARLVDAVTDPLMGLVVERTHSRWGRLRPHILFGAIPLGILAVLTFTVPPLGETGKLWWAYITYVGFGIAYTVVTIPYSALTASMTASHQERTVLSTVRMACAFAGGHVISAFMPGLVGAFETAAAGYQWSLVLYALAATLLLWLTVAKTAERVQPPVEQKTSLADFLKVVFYNPPLLVVVGMFTGGMLSFTIRQTVAVYFFKYNLERPDLIGTWFQITMPIMFVGLIFTPKLAEKVGKAGGIMIGSLVTIASCLGMYMTPYDQVNWIFFWGCVMALGGTPIAVLGWAMLPDTVEYAQWRHGVRADGAIFSMSSFFQKLGKSVGGAGVLAALAAAGYVANEAQSETSLTAIHNMMTLVPAGIMLVMIFFARLYNLDRDRYQQIVSDLADRESDKPGAATGPLAPSQ